MTEPIPQEVKEACSFIRLQIEAQVHGFHYYEELFNAYRHERAMRMKAELKVDHSYGADRCRTLQGIIDHGIS